MAAIVQAQANQILTATLAIGGNATVGAISPMKLKLTTTAPTNTVAGTELSGTGYTAGGTAITFTTASGGSTSGPTGTAISLDQQRGNGLAGCGWAGTLGHSDPDRVPLVVRALVRSAHRHCGGQTCFRSV